MLLGPLSILLCAYAARSNQRTQTSRLREGPSLPSRMTDSSLVILSYLAE